MKIQVIWIIIGSLLLLATACTAPNNESKTDKTTPIDSKPTDSTENALAKDSSERAKLKIEWAGDFEAARRQSQEDGRPVIAYFTFVG